LLDVVRAGLGGSPRAVLVHGEAGIGKTTLVRSVCEQAAGDGAQVLWGQSLRFGAVEAMYHPLVLALEGWLGEADDAGRASVIEAVPGAALILPSLGASPADGRSTLMMVVDALLSRVVARAPTVLVVDDVQWADPATWDALSYLVAGFGRQRLALMTTHRDEATVSDHFQHWLGNIRRLPGTQELVLARLDLDATGDQVAVLLGHPPSPRLVDQVYDRSRGNPYFSELLVRRGDLDSDELPTDVPDELGQALLDSWRGLSSSGREITRVLAVGGRPAEPAVLASVGAGLGVSDSRALHEAIEAGVVVLARERVWFLHPLLADVLLESYLPGEAAPVHAAWADNLATRTAEGVDRLRHLGDLASHQEQAGADSAAFATLLGAADVARALGAFRESAELLTRGADLWDAGAPDRGDDLAWARLLERAGRACCEVDQMRDGHRLVGRAIDLVDPAEEPLWACRLAVLLRNISWHVGEIDDLAAGEVESLVELSRADTDSREHAEALVSYANHLRRQGRAEEAGRVVEEALAAARRAGSPAALSWACMIRSAGALERDLDQADRDAAAAREHAVASGEAGLVVGAFLARIRVQNAMGVPLGHDETVHELYEWSRPYGAQILLPTVFLTDSLLHQGRLVEAQEILRGGLAITGSPNNEANVRLQAAVLAVRRGADDAARDHLRRAREIMPSLEDRPLMVAGPALAELQLAWGNPRDALALIERVLPLSAVNPRDVDELLLWGVRAIGDLVERARDDRDQEALRGHLESLERLLSARAELPGQPFRPSVGRDMVQRARAALYAAELGRGQEAGSVETESLREAVAACAAAGMEWERQCASWRLATALVAAGRAAEVADLLRLVHQFATDQRAFPLKRKVEDLAAMARISLAEPRRPDVAKAPAAFAGLTPREGEVLAHLVANRTYAEIAAALFISEKTVSVHVSNLLRKTATGSRREVAALARRVGWGTGG
jgi:DNA-binding CsgD family transcriptional regulator/tetratricopeptide (TPR) repeat protein